MKRLFYLGVGAALGVVVTRRLTKVAQAWTPQGVAGRAVVQAETLGERVREFAADVRSGMNEREEELRGVLDAEAADRPHR